MPTHQNEAINTRFKAVQNEIRSVATQCNRPIGDIQMLAVSKKQPASTIAELFKATGHNLFGENYSQELEEKARELKDLPISWHFIGKLQSNKISRLVELCDCIQTIETEKHIRYVAKYAAEHNKTPFPVYIAVNAGNEAQKSGIMLSQVASFAEKVKQHPELQLEGIMAIPPSHYNDDNYEFLPDLYQQLSALAKTTGNGKLSLGMSQDLKLAIQSGSTCVRIGRAIFGERL